MIDILRSISILLMVLIKLLMGIILDVSYTVNAILIDRLNFLRIDKII